MINVVIDTNVFIRAFFSNDKWSNKLFQEQHDNNLIIAMSHETHKELCKTIIYIGIKNGLSLSDFKKPFEYLTNCLADIQLVNPQRKFRLSPHDADNKFIDCAYAAKSNYIITEDDHLLSIGMIEPTKKLKDNIKVLSPYQFYIEFNALRIGSNY